jgi:hypothetical protein
VAAQIKEMGSKSRTQARAKEDAADALVAAPGASDAEILKQVEGAYRLGAFDRSRADIFALGMRCEGVSNGMLEVAAHDDELKRGLGINNGETTPEHAPPLLPVFRDAMEAVSQQMHDLIHRLVAFSATINYTPAVRVKGGGGVARAQQQQQQREGGGDQEEGHAASGKGKAKASRSAAARPAPAAKKKSAQTDGTQWAHFNPCLFLGIMGICLTGTVTLRLRDPTTRSTLYEQAVAPGSAYLLTRQACTQYLHEVTAPEGEVRMSQGLACVLCFFFVLRACACLRCAHPTIHVYLTP